MEALFMTSQLTKLIKDKNGNKVPVGCHNSNGLVDKLRENVKSINKFAFIASDPESFERADNRSQSTIKALEIENLPVKELVLIDHRFNGDIKQAILSADIVFLAGGHVPTQNKYFKEIDLKSILKEYKGVVIGQSAGSMNCSELVYAQPESEDEFNNPNFDKFISGLGLTNIIMMPHMNRAKTDELCGTTTYEMCLEDSFKCPHYGISDGGYIVIKDGVATAFGKTVYFKEGKEKVLCEDGQSVVLEENQAICDK